MSIPLPPLPEPRSGWVCEDHHMTWYDADQLHARDQEIVRAVLEAAAKIVHQFAGEHAASVIRALEFTHHE